MDEYLKLFIMVVLLVISLIFLIYYDTLTSIISAFIMLIICAYMVSYNY